MSHPYYRPVGPSTVGDRFALRPNSNSAPVTHAGHPYASSSYGPQSGPRPERVLTYDRQQPLKQPLVMRPSRMEGLAVPYNNTREGSSISTGVSASTLRGGMGSTTGAPESQSISSSSTVQQEPRRSSMVALSTTVPSLRGPASRESRAISNAFLDHSKIPSTYSFEDYDRRIREAEGRKYFEEPASKEEDRKHVDPNRTPPSTQAFLAETAHMLLDLAQGKQPRSTSSVEESNRASPQQLQRHSVETRSRSPTGHHRNPYVGKRSPRRPMDTNASSNDDLNRQMPQQHSVGESQKDSYKAQQLPVTRKEDVPQSYVNGTGLSPTARDAIKVKGRNHREGEAGNNGPTALAKMVLEQMLQQTLEKQQQQGDLGEASSHGRDHNHRRRGSVGMGATRSISPPLAPYDSTPAVFTDKAPAAQAPLGGRLMNGMSPIYHYEVTTLHPKLAAAIDVREQSRRKEIQIEAGNFRSLLIQTFAIVDELERVRESNSRALIIAAERRCRREIVVRTVQHIGNTYHHFSPSHISSDEPDDGLSTPQKIEKAMSFASPDRAAMHNSLLRKVGKSQATIEHPYAVTANVKGGLARYYASQSPPGEYLQGNSPHKYDLKPTTTANVRSKMIVAKGDDLPIIPLRLPMTYRDALLIGSTAAARNDILSEEAWTARMIRLQHVFRYYTQQRPPQPKEEIATIVNKDKVKRLSTVVMPTGLSEVGKFDYNLASPSPLTPTVSPSPFSGQQQAPSSGRGVDSTVGSPLGSFPNLAVAKENRRPSTTAVELKSLIEMAAQKVQEEEDRFGSCESGSGDSYTYEEIWEEESNDEGLEDIRDQAPSGDKQEGIVQTMIFREKTPNGVVPISPTKVSDPPRGGVSPTFEATAFESSSRSPPSLYSMDDEFGVSTSKPQGSSPSQQAFKNKGNSDSTAAKTLIYSQAIADEGHPGIVISAPPKSKVPDNVVLPSSPPRNETQKAKTPSNSVATTTDGKLAAGNAAETRGEGAQEEKIGSPREGLDHDFLSKDPTSKLLSPSPQISQSYEWPRLIPSDLKSPKLAEHQKRLNIVIDTGTPTKVSSTPSKPQTMEAANLKKEDSASHAPKGVYGTAAPSFATTAAPPSVTSDSTAAPPISGPSAKRMSILQALGRDTRHPTASQHVSSGLTSPHANQGHAVGIGGISAPSATNNVNSNQSRPQVIDNVSLAGNATGAGFQSSPLRISSPQAPASAAPVNLEANLPTNTLTPKVSTPLPRTSSFANGLQIPTVQPSHSQSTAQPHPLVGLGGVSLSQVYGSNGPSTGNRQIVASSGLWGAGPLTGFNVVGHHQRGGAFESTEFSELHFEPYAQ